MRRTRRPASGPRHGGRRVPRRDRYMRRAGGWRGLAERACYACGEPRGLGFPMSGPRGTKTADGDVDAQAVSSSRRAAQAAGSRSCRSRSRFARSASMAMRISFRCWGGRSPMYGRTGTCPSHRFRAPRRPASATVTGSDITKGTTYLIVQMRGGAAAPERVSLQLYFGAADPVSLGRRLLRPGSSVPFSALFRRLRRSDLDVSGWSRLYSVREAHSALALSYHGPIRTDVAFRYRFGATPGPATPRGRA